MLALASLSWHGVALELQSLSERASAAPVSEHRVSPYTWQGRLPLITLNGRSGPSEGPRGRLITLSRRNGGEGQALSGPPVH